MSLTLLNIDIGDLANDGTGDPLRVAFEKINNNFSTVASLNSGGIEGSLQYKSGNYYDGSANLKFDSITSILRFDGRLISNTVSNLNLGSADNKINESWFSNTGFYLGNINIEEQSNIVTFSTTVNPLVFASLAGIQDITANGNVTLGRTLRVGNSASGTVNISTNTNATNQVIWQVPASSLSTVRFDITSIESNSFNSQTVTIVINKRPGSASANFVAYGTVFVGNPITRYNADVAFGNVRLMVSPIPNSLIAHKIDFTTED
jgi:hypothetical protein